MEEKKFSKFAVDVREKRNNLLTESDWTQLQDSSLSESDKEKWALYRKELRDITDQEGFPFDITWPVK